MGRWKKVRGWWIPMNFSIVFLLLNTLLLVLGSEFPERECCDPVYPMPPPGPSNTLSASHHGVGGMHPAAFPEYVPPTPMYSVTTDLPGVQTKTATAIMNCIQARDFCMDNGACSPILEIVPRVCGPEKVACTTLTVTKCQAALRTLQAFPYFFPTCLCREPSSDPACNAFREYLFDHPCSFVKEKEKDPYPVDALPTCDYAMDVCKQQPKCHQLYRDFKSHCPYHGGACKMKDGEMCHGAWTKLRLSPMFGCICPNGNGRCEKIFTEVNYNPCVAHETYDFRSTSSALYILDSQRPRSLLHFSYMPSTLFPKPGTHLHRHSQHLSSEHQHHHHNLETNTVVQSARTESHLFVDESFSTPKSDHAYPSPGSFSTSPYGSITVQVIASSHAPEIDPQLETPLLGSPSNYAEQENKPPPFMPPLHTPPPPKTTMSRIDQELPTKQQHIRHPGIATISSVRGGHQEKNAMRVPLHTTCLNALQNCRRSSSCAPQLTNLLRWCDPDRCRQETCMQALQDFYRGVSESHAIEVAFCLCRKSDHHIDQECLQAQQKLHPVCAQRGDLGLSLPSCHSLAENCREQADCKSRLETYEKACAVDSVTRKCAGPTAQCRNATVGILGTVLKKSCACNGTDYNQLYDCLGWQRILWVNPCVVEAQKDYHRVRSTSTTTQSGVSSSSVPNTRLTTSTSSSVSQIPTETETYSQEGTLIGTDLISTTLGHPYETSKLPIPPPPKVTTSPFSPPKISHPTQVRHNNHHSNHGVASERETTYYPSTTFHSRATSTNEFTTLMSTTTRTPGTTTLLPHKYCVVQRPNQSQEQILEGMAKRFYREDRKACSELCVCTSIHSSTSCSVLTCLDTPKSSCSQKQRDNTIMYAHEARSYQASRGNCMCYGGSFVCVKPPQEKYNLNRGVFLFIGFSKVDQDLMKMHTNTEVFKVIETLRNLINPAYHHQFASPTDEGSGIEVLKALNTTNECQLGLFKEEDENLIINATITDEDLGNFTLRQPNDELLIEEKNKCGPILQALSSLINEGKPVIHSHPLLSILKLAEVVENKIPNMRSAAGVTRTFSLILLLLSLSSTTGRTSIPSILLL